MLLRNYGHSSKIVKKGKKKTKKKGIVITVACPVYPQRCISRDNELRRTILSSVLGKLKCRIFEIYIMENAKPRSWIMC